MRIFVDDKSDEPMKYLLMLAFAALTAACGPKQPRSAAHAGAESPQTEASAAKPYRFRSAALPAAVAPEEARAYLRDHYWDRFDFGDSTLVVRADTQEMLRAMAAYVANFLTPADSTAVERLMASASASKPMFDYFAMLASEVLYDPNSPLRCEELYLPVLRAQVASPLLDKWERLGPQHDLALALRNRVGHPAEDFRYTLADGSSHRLYDIEAEYVLLFINNPGCPMCKEVREAITASPMLNERIERGALEVLALYPDEDLGEWLDYRSEIPVSWINAYDKGCRIAQEELYDLRAIPTLYLLDGRKRVLVKDAVDVGRIEWAIDHRDGR